MKGTRRALLASLLLALTVAFGYALSGLPNVELMTIMAVVSGYLLGARLGAVVGGGSMLFHSLFNPLGAALPPLMISQVFSFALIAICGALLAPALQGVVNRWGASILAGLLGLFLTFFYDVMTSVAAFYTSFGPREASTLWKFVAGGVVFMGMHQVWNAGLFFFVLRPMLNVLSPFRSELV